MRLIRLAVTVGLLTGLLWLVADPGELISIIRDVSPVSMVIAVSLSAIDRAVMAFKWWLLLRARGIVVGRWLATRAYFASSLYGLILPVTVGADIVRIVAFRRFGLTEITASIVVERLLGAIAMGSVALLSCLLLASTVTDYAVQPLTTWLMLIVVISVSLFVFSLYAADHIKLRFRRVPEKLQQALKAYGTYRRYPLALGVFYLLSVIESLIAAVIAYVISIGIGHPLPLYLLVATVPIALASARLPISLGGFGVQEASFVFLAGLVGVSSTHALSIFLLVDVTMLIALLPALLDGPMLTLRRHISD